MIKRTIQFSTFFGLPLTFDKVRGMLVYAYYEAGITLQLSDGNISTAPFQTNRSFLVLDIQYLDNTSNNGK